MSNELLRDTEVDRFPSVKRRTFISADGKEPGNAVGLMTGSQNPYNEKYCKLLEDMNDEFLENIKAI